MRGFLFPHFIRKIHSFFALFFSLFASSFPLCLVCQTSVFSRLSNVFFAHAQTPQNTPVLSCSHLKRRSRKKRFFISLLSSLSRVSRAVEWHWPFLEEQQQEQHSRRFPRWKEDFYEED
jgi:hypothetical protein